MTKIIIIVLIFVAAYFIYMKFFLPKIMAKTNANLAEADKEFAEKGAEMVDEFTTNPNKFGLVKQTLGGEKLYGIYSATLHKDIKFSDKMKEEFVSAITLTSEVDMSMSYLVAAEDGLHYMVFDGKKCIQNEVFNYGFIVNQRLTNDSYTFDYKEDKIKFSVTPTLNFYPRFNVHEVSVSGSGQGGLRVMNDFIREWLAYESTDNVEYKNRVLHKPATAAKFVQGRDFFIDSKIREVLLEGFKDKLGVHIEG